jgi:hypothetical protein
MRRYLSVVILLAAMGFRVLAPAAPLAEHTKATTSVPTPEPTPDKAAIRWLAKIENDWPRIMRGA